MRPAIYLHREAVGNDGYLLMLALPPDSFIIKTENDGGTRLVMLSGKPLEYPVMGNFAEAVMEQTSAMRVSCDGGKAGLWKRIDSVQELREEVIKEITNG